MTDLASPPASTEAPSAALAVEDLEVVYTVRGIDRAVLRGVSFSPEDGRRRALRTGAALEMPTVDPGE